MPVRAPSIGRALSKALKERPPGPEDVATVALARRIAAEIDGAESVATVDKLTPRLLAVLAALGLTPTSRTVSSPAGDAVPGGGVVSVGRDVVAEQRARYGDPR